MPTQKNSASWDLQLGFNLAFKRLMSIQDNATQIAVLQLEISDAPPPQTGVAHIARYEIYLVIC
jgi:hypothetical protein